MTRTRLAGRPALWFLLTLLGGAAAWAQTQPIIVTITDVGQIGGSFDPLDLGDFYAEVTVDGTTLSTVDDRLSFTLGGYILPTGNLLGTPWVLRQDIPADRTTVHLRFALYDHDEFTGDEQGDINPDGSKSVVDIDVDLLTGTWSGDLEFPTRCSSGPPDLDSRSAELCFDLDFDSDRDGLLDSWERDGADTDDDGTIDVDLPSLGAHPLRKDVFVEIDCLVAADHTHCPRQDAVDDVVRAFANAPVQNGDGTTGVQLHVDTGSLFGATVAVAGDGGVFGFYGNFGGGGDAIPEAGNEIIDSFVAPLSSGTPFAVLKQDFFDEKREPVFRYGIFGHQTNVRRADHDCTSGVADGIPGHDFMVTLGGSGPFFTCWTEDAGGSSVGSRGEQGGTLMHELGHGLGLQHGGNESITTNNPKPNYLSVMSYAFQTCSVPASPNGVLPGGCDYSRFQLPSQAPFALIEDDLDECIGIGDYGVLGFGPVDWDRDTLLEGATYCQPPYATNVVADINNDGLKTVLGGFDDWSNLDLISGVGGAGGGGAAPIEADPQAIEEARQRLSEALAPGVALSKTGPATARPGDVITYTIEMTNQGPGPALAAVLTDEAPDGVEQDFDLGALIVGGDVTRTRDFTVPADACPGDFTGASATVAFQDVVGNAFDASGSAALEILDVAPPALSVSVSPNVLWPPNHKFVPIAATIEVSDNCDPDPVVTLVSVVSNEPESAYIGNGDQGPDVDGANLGTDDRSFSLRAERATFPASTGRVYTITYRATDVWGNASEAIAHVTVPRNRGN